MTGNIAGQTPVMQKFILVLIIFTLIISACLFYLLPELASYQRMTASADSASAGLNVQINDVAVRKAREDADRSKFEMLEKEGFMSQQDRLNAARILEILRIQHRMTGLEYQIEPVRMVPVLRQPENTGVTMSVSKISLGLRGFLDGDAHDFIKALKRGLPGHVVITELELEKIIPLSDELLAHISSGDGGELVKGSVELQWRSALPDAENSGQSAE